MPRTFSRSSAFASTEARLPCAVRSSATVIALLTLLAVLFSSPATAQKKRKGGKNKGQQAQPANAGDGLYEVRLALLRYDTQKARTLLDRAATSPAADVLRAEADGLDQRYAPAAQALEAIAGSAPSAEALLALGEVRSRQEQKGAADQAFQRASELAQARADADAQDASAFFDLGVARHRLGQHGTAIEALVRARDLEPKRAATFYWLGRALVAADRWQEAIDHLNAAVERESGLAYAYYYRGLAFNKLDQKSAMINDFERFVALAPNAPEADRARRLVQAAGG